MNGRPVPPPPPPATYEPWINAALIDATARKLLAQDARALLEAAGTARRDRLTAHLAAMANVWANWSGVAERFEAETAESPWPDESVEAA